MKTRVKRTDISSFAPLFLFALFAICVIVVLLTGAGIYKSAVERDSAGFDRRSVSQYIATRIRQSDSRGSFFVSSFDKPEPAAEGDTFFCREVIDGEEYLTRIYCHEGYLCELFSLAGEEFTPDSGERVIAVSSLCFRTEGDLIVAEVGYSDGSQAELVFAPRSGREAE